jgi:hypothetical protein
MTYVITSANPINPIAAPRLPNAPTEYEQRYLDSLNSILRLYFNQLDNTIRQLQAATKLDTLSLTVYTVSTLPSAVTSGAGTLAFVSDALLPTFGSTVVGGGAVKVPVYSDGTNWKVG